MVLGVLGVLGGGVLLFCLGYCKHCICMCSGVGSIVIGSLVFTIFDTGTALGI